MGAVLSQVLLLEAILPDMVIIVAMIWDECCFCTKKCCRYSLELPCYCCFPEYLQNIFCAKVTNNLRDILFVWACGGMFEESTSYSTFEYEDLDQQAKFLG